MFKFVAVLAFVACASALSPHQLNSLSGGHLSSHHDGGHLSSHHDGGHLSSHHDGGHSSSHVSAEDVHAEIKSLESDVNEHGFHYAFDTTNHISAAASGDEHGNIHGDFAWISPEGEHIAVKYVADEYGYQPSSDVLPTPPPIPHEILKALDYIRSHPAHEEHHGHY